MLAIQARDSDLSDLSPSDSEHADEDEDSTERAQPLPPHQLQRSSPSSSPSPVPETLSARRPFANVSAAENKRKSTYSRAAPAKKLRSSAKH
jgi:hypothetical protein